MEEDWRSSNSSGTLIKTVFGNSYVRRELRRLAKMQVMQWYYQLRYRVVRNGQCPVLKDKDKVIVPLAEMKVLS